MAGNHLVIPLDRIGERRRRKVRTSDESYPFGVGLKNIGLEVEAVLVGFEYPHHEVTGKFVKATQRRGFRDVKIISDKNPCSSSPRQKISKV